MKAHQYSSPVTSQQKMNPEPSSSASHPPPPLTRAQANSVLQAAKLKCLALAVRKNKMKRKYGFYSIPMAGRHRVSAGMEADLSNLNYQIDLELARMRSMTPQQAAVAAFGAVLEAEAAADAAEEAEKEAQAAEAEAEAEAAEAYAKRVIEKAKRRSSRSKVSRSRN